MLITLPYRERAALAIRDSAQNSGILSGVVDAASLKTIFHKPSSDKKNTPEFNQTVGAKADLLRGVANRFRSPRISLAAMHASKALFDRDAARVVPDSVSTIVGFPGASRRTFKSARPSVNKVLHCVDAHPRFHNSALLSQFSKAECHAELYPAWLIDRIEHELSLADTVLVPSRLVARQMLENRVEASKIVLQPYGVDFELFRPKSPNSKTSARRKPMVLYVGQLSQRKGIRFLIEAARNLSVDIELIGNVFDPSILKNAPTNVRLLQPMSHAELVNKYHEADAFVIPTVEDACSLVALEAAAAGLPVISTHANGAMEILPSEVTRILEPANVTCLQEALRDVVRLDGTQRKLNADITRAGSVRSWSEYGDAVVNRTQAVNDD